MRAHVITFGCQMNEYDTHTIQSELVAGGHELVSHPTAADLLLLDTCAVRGKPVEKVISVLGDLLVGPGAITDLVDAVAEFEDLPRAVKVERLQRLIEQQKARSMGVVQLTVTNATQHALYGELEGKARSGVALAIAS